MNKKKLVDFLELLILSKKNDEAKSTMNALKLNRSIFIRNNLEVLRCIKDKTVDLIYLDPPFNSNKNWGAPIGSKQAGFHFKDMWYLSDTDEAWWGELSEKYPSLYSVLHAVGTVNGNKDKSYLIYMAIRLIEMKRILKDTGSIYFHVDQTMSHSIKLVMDAVFGKNNFRNEIIWRRSSGRSKIKHQKGVKTAGKNTDHIFHYSGSNNFTFKDFLKELTNDEIEKKFPKKDPNGDRYNTTVPIFNSKSMGARPNQCYEYKGVYPPHKSGWRFIKESLIKLDKQGGIIWRKGKNPLRKSFAKDYKGYPLGNLWTDIDFVGNSKENTDYKTQKPLPLLERIIEASSNKGDLVLDPFCGCATTCIAAEKLDRKWLGIDLSEKASDLIKDRLQKELNLKPSLVTIRKDLPIKNAPKPSKDVKHVMYGKQKGNCEGCETHFQIQHLTIDHIIPRSKGGQDTDKNLQLLCPSCNSIKGNRLSMSELKAELIRRGYLKKKQYKEAA